MTMRTKLPKKVPLYQFDDKIKSKDVSFDQPKFPSKHINVQTSFVTDLERNNLLISDNNTIMISTQKPLVLHCPFDSHPPANITWIVNKTQIVINNYATGPHENRRVKGFIYMLTRVLLILGMRILGCSRVIMLGTCCLIRSNYLSLQILSVAKRKPAGD